MKQTTRKNIIGITIFFLILGLIFALIQPVYNRISKEINSREQELLSKLTDMTGLSVSYESLSPSLIAGINIKNISLSAQLKDSEGNDLPGEEIQVLSVKKVIVAYNLLKIIKGDWNGAFSKLVISDISLEISQSFINSLMKMNASDSENKTDETSVNNKSFDMEKSIEGLKTIVFSLPFDVSLRNISAVYSVGANDFKASVRDLNLKKNDINQSITSNLNGIVSAKLGALGGKTMGVKFSIEGNLSSVFAGSSVKILFDEYSRCDFSLKKLESLLVYDDGKFILRTVQQLNPYNFYIDFNTRNGLLSAEIMFNRLDPFTLVRGSKYSDWINYIKGSRISGNTKFQFDLNTLQYKWSTDNRLNLSKKICENGQNLDIKANGNNTYITVEKLYAFGDMTEFTFTGGFDITKLVPEGFLKLDYFKLPDENKISAEMLVQPDGKDGFIAFIPELHLGRQVFSSLEISLDKISSSMHFSLDGYDYTHADYENPGKIHLDGSFLSSGGQYLQASVSLDSIFLDSIARAGYFFIQKEPETDYALASSLKPYISSLELYVSTDFKSITFNSPYVLAANTQSKSQQVLLVSLDGSESGINVSQFNLLYDQNSLTLTAQTDFSPADGQIIFNSSMALNSIPYELNGVFADKWLNINGNYGLDFTADFKEGIIGSLKFDSLPVKYMNYLLSLGFSGEFAYLDLNHFNVDINLLSVDELNGNFRTRPKINLAASLEPAGLNISSITLTDNLTSLSGDGKALLDISDDGIFESLKLNLDLKNEFSPQKISVNGIASNPQRKPLTAENIKNNISCTVSADIKEFPLGFFIGGQQLDNTFSAVLSASGTVSNAYVSANISNVSYNLGGSPLIASGSMTLRNSKLNIITLDGDWYGITLSKSSGSFDLADFEGTLNTTLAASLNSRKFILPLTIDLENLDPEKTTFMPSMYSFILNSPHYEGDMFEENKHALTAQIIRTPGRFDFITDEYLGFYGDYSDDGYMHFAIAEDKPFHFNLDGSIKKNIMDLSLVNVYADVAMFKNLINTEYFSVYKATLEGHINVSGLATDPNFEGSAKLRGVDINFPAFVPDHAYTGIVPIDFSQDEIVVPKTSFNIRDGRFEAGAIFEMDRWSLSSMDITLVSEKDKDIPVDIRIPLIRIKGHTAVDAKLTMEGRNIVIGGDIGLRNSEISLVTNMGTGGANIDYGIGSSPAEPVANPWDCEINLNLKVGQKVQIVMNPLLRGLVAPDTPVSFSMDQSAGLWNLKGDVVLRGGELSYLNRNFYLKEGRIILNETQNYFNPYISVRAETREHDDNGDPITITVSAIRQNVSNFKATLYSTPAKSETEILGILGQIAAGDASSMSNFLLSTVDYGVSVTVIRKIESALRDLFNFDIFSVRTTFLQNTLKQGFAINTGLEKGTFGSNLFDNSTVYIGKYFGSSIYADALMHWSYDETKTTKSDAKGGLVFQPEVGLELDSPFANIRWSFAPDLGEFQQSWASASSITLSWRWSF